MARRAPFIFPGYLELDKFCLYITYKTQDIRRQVANQGYQVVKITIPPEPGDASALEVGLFQFRVPGRMSFQKKQEKISHPHNFSLNNFAPPYLSKKMFRDPIFSSKNISCPHNFPKKYFAPPYSFLKIFQISIFFRENISDPRNFYILIYRIMPKF